ncbi:MAG: 2TM domain-containing protein [Flavisolibacter sp.]|nr:2TM domain-containing protein [Flavisolibacter sp.]MBD0284106.1 2TM domain-containing protein [Flavisolibacter sp.]MBD0350978.1 2TM domain-containing protein [Flavisolibacter sp.]
MEQNTNSSFREDYQNAPSRTGGARDPQLWKLAEARASFKRHFSIYLIISLFFWALWFFTGGREYSYGGIPWPVWPMLGWVSV